MMYNENWQHMLKYRSNENAIMQFVATAIVLH